ncbi:MAG: saccharopine dehydrogenase NADP-binding domain-containing protein [Bacteroidales bacterium]|nr:saccharopine dehydrogenase NADP-binding domain-containing protein [Bacteroidales bacterium]
MNKVLVLGAGLVAKPLIRHLLSKNYLVTVASNTPDRAAEMVDGHQNGDVIEWDVKDEESLAAMVASHDLTVSLLPYAFHLIVAKQCVRFAKNMVTTSYVKPEMQDLDSAAKEAGIIILNETGLDPGIDHMSAMRIIDHVHDHGGKIEEFYSICGALPAPEAANNPFRYKFSWSPKGVVLAGNNDARYLKDGKEVFLPTRDLFKSPWKTDFPGVGKLDIYPNRDSISYIEVYGIPETKTICRGTFRFPGWCETLDAIKQMNLIDPAQIDLTGLSFAGLVAKQIGADSEEDIENKVAAFLGLSQDATAMKAMQWLGLFDLTPMNRGVDSAFEVTSDLMISKMELGSTERDMVVMQHTFLASYPDGKQEVIRSRMLDFGTPATDTSIARTVALPAAIAVEMILEGKILEKGVFRPVLPGIYNPILTALEGLDIRMEEEFGLPLVEMPGR